MKTIVRELVQFSPEIRLDAPGLLGLGRHSEEKLPPFPSSSKAHAPRGGNLLGEYGKLAPRDSDSVAEALDVLDRSGGRLRAPGTHEAVAGVDGPVDRAGVHADPRGHELAAATSLR